MAQNQEKTQQLVVSTMSKPDGIVLLALDELKAILGAVLCFSVCSVLILSLFFLAGSIRVLIFVALFVFLFAALALMHVAIRKADLLRLAHRLRTKA